MDATPHGTGRLTQAVNWHKKMVNCNSAKGAVATVAIFVALMLPTAIGVAFLASPPSEREPPEWVKVTTLSLLPADGVPRRFLVSVACFDTWERLPDKTIGTVFLRRVPTSGEVLGLQGEYYLGSPVEFDVEAQVFRDVCWGMQCDINGKRIHSIARMGDIERVRVVIREKSVYVKLEDVIDDAT